MRFYGIAAAAILGVAACEPVATATSTEPEAPTGPALEITQATRAGDTTTVSLRYRNGSAIPVGDEPRAVRRAMEIACNEGENPIADTRTRDGGLLMVNVFCVGVRSTDETIDGSGLLS